MSEELAREDYVRKRIDPRPGDPMYLHLSDLCLALRGLIPLNVARVLDFGCGGSPYRSLFQADVYHRADLAGSGAGLDFEYGFDSVLPVSSQNYDCVLSSQVLEHVPSPKAYLAECYRSLRPEGYLLLSTHGLFEDHACPYDYWRWTVYGLQMLVEEAGFCVEQIKKLTTGPRAAVFIAERERDRLKSNRFGIYGWVTERSHLLRYGSRFFCGQDAGRVHRACDQKFPQFRVVDPDEQGHNMYIAITLVARRI